MEFCMTVSNVLDRVLPLTGYVTRDASALISDPACFHLRLALHELVTNAIEHGNLAISSQEKTDALIRGEYESMVEERCRDARYRDRRATITVTYDREGGLVRYRISDQGHGFDWRQELRRSASIDPQTAGSGRGIHLAKTLVDDLTYNEKGNEAIVTLFLNRISQPL